MLIQTAPNTTKMMAFRADDEMACGLVALASSVNSDRSTLIRAACANLLRKARKKRPLSLTELIEDEVA